MKRHGSPSIVIVRVHLLNFENLNFDCQGHHFFSAFFLTHVSGRVFCVEQAHLANFRYKCCYGAHQLPYRTCSTYKILVFFFFMLGMEMGGGFQSREWTSCRNVIDLGVKLGFVTYDYLRDNKAIEYSVQTLKRGHLSFQFLTMA